MTPLPHSAAVAAKIAVPMSFALPSIALVVAAAASVTPGTALGGAQAIELVDLMWIATTPLTALVTLIGLTFTAEATQSVRTLAFIVLWLLGGTFTEPSNMPGILAAIARTLPSYAIIQAGWSASPTMTTPSTADLLTTWSERRYPTTSVTRAAIDLLADGTRRHRGRGTDPATHRAPVPRPRQRPVHLVRLRRPVPTDHAR